MAYSKDFEVFETNYFEKFFKKRIFLTAKGTISTRKYIHFHFLLQTTYAKVHYQVGKPGIIHEKHLC